MLCLVTQVCLTLCNAMDCSPPGTSVHGDSPGKNTGVGSLSLLQDLSLCLRLKQLFWPGCAPFVTLVPWPGIEPMPPAVKVQSPNH